MTEDPIVREVREIRHQIEKECQQDSEKYYQHLKTLQNKFAERLVSRHPKPLVTTELKQSD